MTTPPGFDELPVEDKIAYVQALWDLIASDPGELPVPEWHREIIDRRLTEARSTSAVVRTWPEVEIELHARLLQASER